MDFQELLELLVCPKCKGGLERDIQGKDGWLICRNCKLKFRVEGGIPNMIIEDAERLE